MVHKYYNLVFYGEILDGYSGRDVRQNLIAMAYLDPETQESVMAGKPIVVREHLDYMAATIMQSTCEMQGARCQIELAQITTSAGDIDPAYFCQIEFRGEVAAGCRLSDVKTALQQRFRLSPQALEQLFSGQPRIIKAKVDYQTALQYLTALEGAGAVCHVIPSHNPLPPDRIQGENIFRPANLDTVICPNCGKRQPVSPTCTQCGIAMQRFTKKRLRTSAAEPGKTSHILISRPDEADDAIQDTPSITLPVNRPEAPRWIYWMLGNVILAFVLSLVGFSIEGFLVPFSLIAGANDVTKYTNLFALFYSNLQMVGLTGIFFPVVMSVREWFVSHEKAAMRHVYLLILLVPLGAALMIDFFVSVFVGFKFVTMFVLKGLGFSIAGYGIGFGCWRLVHRGEKPLDESEETESSVDESAAESDESHDGE